MVRERNSRPFGRREPALEGPLSAPRGRRRVRGLGISGETAALDEEDNDCFNRIVGEFVSESQLIIITQSKRTMNIADQLYGITMQEPGVSTQVGVQLTGAVDVA